MKTPPSNWGRLLFNVSSMQQYISARTRQTFLLRKMQASVAILLPGAAISKNGVGWACTKAQRQPDGSSALS